MPRHLSPALDTITAWPRLEDRFYTNDTGREFVAYPPGGEVIGEYLHSIGVWQQYGLELAPPARAQLRELWKHRLDLRSLLGEAIGYFVCEEFLPRWDEEDIHVYARALAALDWRQVALFVEQQPTLRAIAEAAGALTGRAVS